MAINSGVNYASPKILSPQHARDLLEILVRDTKRKMPDAKTQRKLIHIALDKAHKTHPDFTLTKLERDDQLEDVVYYTLKELLLHK